MGLLGAAAIVGGSSLIGGLLSKGSKPKVPEFKPIDFAGEQKKAIQQNLQSLPAASELAQKTTTADQSVLEEQLRRAIPGYDKLIAQAGSNIGASLRGEISPEVSAQVQRSTAGRALSGGFGGASGMGRSLTARDLGLTGMQIQNQGLQQAQSFIQQQRAYGMVQPFSTSSMFITPAQRVGVMQQQQQAQYGRDLQAAQVAAMPDPTMAAFGSAISSAGGLYGGAKMQQSLSNGRQPSPYDYGNVDTMMNGPSQSQNLYSQPMNFGSSGYGNYRVGYN
jgi:hypothetical protein